MYVKGVSLGVTLCMLRCVSGSNVVYVKGVSLGVTLRMLRVCLWE